VYIAFSVRRTSQPVNINLVNDLEVHLRHQKCNYLKGHVSLLIKVF